MQKAKPRDDKGKAVARLAEGEIPAELDFFKYAQGGPAKRKAPENQQDDREGRGTANRSVKKQRTGEAEVASEPDDDEDSRMPRHRVTTKGSNVPEHIESFQTLQDRYKMSSHLLSNVTQSGYKWPTGIQSYGIPILLEVRPP